jgi:hypothetical protein
VLDLPFPDPIAVEQISVDLAETPPVERRAAVLTVLTGRGIELSAAQRVALAETADLDQLRAWLTQAVTATSAGELFC